MKCELQIELIANAGVFIRYKDTTIMIDGIFGKNILFSPIPLEMKKAVFGMDSKYRDADYILFTHRHNDHFSGMFLKEYLKNNKVKKVYLPAQFPLSKDIHEDNSGFDRDTCPIFNEFQVPLEEEFSMKLEDGISLSCYGSTHMGGTEYENTAHCIYNLNFEGKNYLFAADADATNGNFNVAGNSRMFAAVFVNTLFYASKKGQVLLDTVLRPDRVVIYHLPFDEDDESNLRGLAAQKKNKNQQKNYETILLMEKGQKLSY